MRNLSRAEDFVSKYEIKIGIEEEVFIVNKKGFLSPFSEELVSTLIKMIGEENQLLENARRWLLGLQWEPNPSQIEYVTRAVKYWKVKDAIKFGRKLLGQAAKKISHRIFLGSMHPIQSDPLPINGTHINISFKPVNKKKISKELLTYVFNHVRNHIPEIIAMTANTPLMGGKPSGYASSRLAFSRVLKPSNFAVVKRKPVTVIPREMRSFTRYGVLFEKLKKYKARIITNPLGVRLLDITPRGPDTNIVEDMRTSVSTSRIEIRVIDNQITEEYLSDIVKILLALSVEAIFKFEKEEKVTERKKLLRNRDRAIKNGTAAIFINDDGTTINARESIIKLMERISPFLDALNLKLETKLELGIPEIEVFGSPDIIDEYEALSELENKGKICVDVRLEGKRLCKTLFGEAVEIGEMKKVSGLLFPEYQCTWTYTGNGLIRNFNKIIVKHWLATKNGYIPIFKNDKIERCRNPLTHLSSIFNTIGKRVIYQFA